MRSYNNPVSAASFRATSTSVISGAALATVHGRHKLAPGLATAGFRVFPLVPNDKKPAIDDWKQQASDAPDRIHRFWSEALSGDPLDYNIGIATGSGLIVLDVDNKDGKNGSAALERLELCNSDLPATFTVNTPTGGEHLYFRLPPDVYAPNSASKLGDGLDIRGDGGYVAGPWSEIEGRFYEVSQNRPIAAAPPWLVERVRAPKPSERQTAAPAIDLDTPEAIAAATKWLQRHAPEHGTYSVACRVLDHALSVGTAVELMVEYWNPRRVEPRSEDHIRQRVEHAEAYRQTPVGSSSAELEFDDVSDEVSTTSKMEVVQPADAWAFQTADEADRGALTATHKPLVRDYLDCGAMSLLYGAPGQAKTFSALYLAYCVASGQPWAGNRVTQGLVFYLVAEGGGGFRKRVRALKQVYGFGADLPLVFLPLSVDLRNPNDVKGLAKTIRAAEERFGQKCVLTVIDTVSRVLAGGDENSSTDMGGLIRNFDKVREAIGCHLMAIHHTGKDDSRGARGWSGLKAALDTELEVKDGSITVKKQRDLEFGEPVVFHLEGAEIGRGPEGETVTSAVVRIGEKPKPVEAAEEFEHALTEREEQMLRAFDRAVLKKYGEKYVRGAKEFYLTGPEWDAEMTESLPVIGANDGLSRQTLDGFRRELTEKGAVEKGKRGQWLRKA